MNTSIRLVAFLLLFSSVATTSADIVFSVEVVGSDFDVFMRDNDQGVTAGTFGVASYGVPLVGDILSVDHNSPNGAVSPDSGFIADLIGFSLLRSGDDTLLMAGSQDTITPTPHLVFNIGRSAGDLSSSRANANPFIGVESDAYDVKVLIASGTWNQSGIAPSINVASANFFANVFTSTNTMIPTTKDGNATAVPEPSLALFWIALIGGRMGIGRWRRLKH